MERKKDPKKPMPKPTGDQPDVIEPPVPPEKKPDVIEPRVGKKKKTGKGP